MRASVLRDAAHGGKSGPGQRGSAEFEGQFGFGVGDGSTRVNLRRKTVVTVISKIGDRKPKADACLVVIYGQAIGHKYVLKPGEILIGRSSQAAIQIDHESVSRRHARLLLSESGVSLSDLGSTNGTYVNDEPITERTL